ncbi:MAG: hypothetical protein KGL43_21955 [Burkholderiales bacterium]|nr:hypothetical protein [Burkholderiales bacterium]MDE2393878.1 hypothetical protein [Burkholderiales bacterium]MDE2456261.1 hypothetical protein [Burkholderiales bacterium]
MNHSTNASSCATHYELRYTNLFNAGRGYVFPCDATGHVDIAGLSDRCRDNYLYARVVVGHELSLPTVVLACPH